MKAKFEFSLPEEQDTYDMYAMAPLLFNAMFDIKNELRSLDKVGKQSLSRERFYEILAENELEI